MIAESDILREQKRALELERDNLRDEVKGQSAIISDYYSRVIELEQENATLRARAEQAEALAEGRQEAILLQRDRVRVLEGERDRLRISAQETIEALTDALEIACDGLPLEKIRAVRVVAERTTMEEVVASEQRVLSMVVERLKKMRGEAK